MSQTVREWFASGAKGGFAEQLLRTYDDPCDGNFRLLRAVADGRNFSLVDDAVAYAEHYIAWAQTFMLRGGLERSFPMLSELDREVAPDDCARLPREAAKGDEK